MYQFYTPFQPTLTQEGLKQFGLTLRFLQPCEALKGKVHYYLQINAERPTPYPVIPDGTQAIYFSSQGGMIAGAQLTALDVQLLEPGEYFGIWFYPGALRSFFNLNLSEITGQFVDDKYFQCRYFSELYIDIYKENIFSDRAKVCESWLLKRYSYQPTTRFDMALQLIYKSAGREPIYQIANKVGWSTRHLNRLFLQHTGLGSKSFSRIVRVQNTSRKLYLSPNHSLNGELELGYSDQPHLIKEFKKYLLATPSEFVSRFMSDSYNP